MEQWEEWEPIDGRRSMRDELKLKNQLVRNARVFMFYLVISAAPSAAFKTQKLNDLKIEHGSNKA